MKLQQLRYLQEVSDAGMNLSAASEALHTSQSGISRQILALEEELGTKLLVRRGKRILGLTDAGREVLAISRRMLLDAERVKRVTQDLSGESAGDFVIATTHTHARYALPGPIRAFMTRWPAVRLSLRQGNPQEIAAWVANGTADIAIAAMPQTPAPGVTFLPCYDLHRLILAPTRHPVLAPGKLTLERIARYPMITYDSAFTGRVAISRRFEAAGLFPHVALSATDADLMKVYVKLGFGIAIVGEIAYRPGEDRGLRAVSARHLFEPNRIYVGLNGLRHLRVFMFDFIALVAPHLTRPVVERLLRGGVWDGPVGDHPGQEAG